MDYLVRFAAVKERVKALGMWPAAALYIKPCRRILRSDGAEFKDYRAAAAAVGICDTTIHSAIRKKRTIKGFQWFWADEGIGAV